MVLARWENARTSRKNHRFFFSNFIQNRSKILHKIKVIAIRGKNRQNSIPWDGFCRKKSILGGFGDPREDPEFAKSEQKDNCAEHLGPLPLSKLSQSAPKPDFGSPEGSRGSSWRPRDSISGGLFGISLGLLHRSFYKQKKMVAGIFCHIGQFRMCSSPLGDVNKYTIFGITGDSNYICWDSQNNNVSGHSHPPTTS